MENDFLPIGKVVKPHGVKGKIKVKYYGEDLNRFSHYRKVILPDGSGNPQTYDIVEAVSQPPLLILQLKGIERIEDVLPLVGKEIQIRKDALPDLEEGEYYWMDLLGMLVETEDGRKIGTVKEIFATGANDVYVVEGKRGEIFLPATGEVIKSVDRQRKVIKAHWMEGLWETEDEV
ncbi:MAG: 16S rRNA processing protein RimM [Deltaproteobacteria bacterium RBG_13_52_11b]|nr:MAG: 16S rRNA processing protein RimM [Deltaproteobacteria bacterium RBG_13_52_11b]